MTSKKELAMRILAPYFKNRELCGFDGDLCRYKIEKDGVVKKCAIGSIMTEQALEKCGEYTCSIKGLLSVRPQSFLFKEEYVDVFTADELLFIQSWHDSLVSSYIIIPLEGSLFSRSEFMRYVESK